MKIISKIVKPENTKNVKINFITVPQVGDFIFLKSKKGAGVIEEKLMVVSINHYYSSLEKENEFDGEIIEVYLEHTCRPKISG